MKRISKLPFVLKWVVPLLWFGFLVLILALESEALRARPATIIAPIVMAVIGLVIFKKLVWDLADEVFDGGEYLVFKKGDLEQRVQLADVERIWHVALSSPPRVTIISKSPGALGTKIAFTVATSWNPFSTPVIVDELAERIEMAKR